ncbi:PH domain-containing protein [Oceanirhabdus seepicola]|uniref:PH domain-containing protein n=1 Tax=Oceanirhabdus seepicola TaxID=2828781 RepID=A0A9J6NXU3_9CLOT|nr:PH domain-containing protein [Oceanirhabdus seepicola]MCM1988814.1 PH domain-containing protein [Oceanirhabdus seepicola]
MFGKLAADALGISDIGMIISPSDYEKVDSDDYIFSEDGEKIYFLIKSKSDEYCFTNYGLIHLDGSSAISKKRILNRYEFKYDKVKEVRLETAGTVDLDVEIKFVIGEKNFSIDVKKNQIDELKKLYKALYGIYLLQQENEKKMNIDLASIDVATNCLGKGRVECDVVQAFSGIFNQARGYREKASRKYNIRDYSEVYEKYIV